MRFVFACLMASTLLFAVGLTSAQEASGPAEISITISNRSGVELSLDILESPGIPQPPSIAQSAASMGAPKARASALPTKPRQSPGLRVKPGRSSTLALKPGQYHLRAESLSRGHSTQVTMGFVSVTNAEVWVFNLDENGQTIGGQDRKWVMEVPSRPGFRLSTSPENSTLPLPQRISRPAYSPPPSFAPPLRAPRPSGTNSSK
jgi:hypothetical protein